MSIQQNKIMQMSWAPWRRYYNPRLSIVKYHELIYCQNRIQTELPLVYYFVHLFLFLSLHILGKERLFYNVLLLLSVKMFVCD